MSQEKFLNEKVAEWLGLQGYPLEMKVASTLRNSGFLVQHSAHYVDPETSKSREIDIICTLHDQTGMAEIHFVIECKSTKKPWVIFSAEYTRENLNALQAFAITSKRAREFITDNAQNLYDSLTWVVKKGRVGYSITQAFAEGQDITYEATLSAVKASVSLYNENESQKIYKTPFFFAFPVIVTASPLFECYLDQVGNVNVQEIQEGTFYFDGKIENFSGTCIRVVSDSALGTFKNDIHDISEYLLTLLKEDIETEWINWQKRANSAQTDVT